MKRKPHQRETSAASGRWRSSSASSSGGSDAQSGASSSERRDCARRIMARPSGRPFQAPPILICTSRRCPFRCPKPENLLRARDARGAKSPTCHCEIAALEKRRSGGAAPAATARRARRRDGPLCAHRTQCIVRYQPSAASLRSQNCAQLRVGAQRRALSRRGPRLGRTGPAPPSDAARGGR